MIETTQTLTLISTMIELIENELNVPVSISFSFDPRKELIMTIKTWPTSKSEKQYAYDQIISKIELLNMRLLEEDWVKMKCQTFVNIYLDKNKGVDLQRVP